MVVIFSIPISKENCQFLKLETKRTILYCIILYYVILYIIIIIYYYILLYYILWYCIILYLITELSLLSQNVVKVALGPLITVVVLCIIHSFKIQLTQASMMHKTFNIYTLTK